jgi:hypothetical protein
MLLKFVDRGEELAFLEEKWREKKPQLIVIYGRRRIGKTELIKQFIMDKPSFYFLAKKQKLELEVERFAKRFSANFNTYVEARGLEELFERVSGLFTGRYVIVIDEFSYWMEEDKGVTSTLQLIWDETLSKSQVFLILCGSSVGMMESLFSYRNPLYGRRTGQWRLTPLRFGDLRGFLPSYSPEDLARVYACTGGIPLYLAEFEDGRSFEENLRNTFYRKGSILYEDGEWLLREELRQPTVYLNILTAIAEGSTRLSEIAGKSRVDITNISKYLKVLLTLDLIKKEFPVGKVERKSRDFIYKVKDLYYSFWLRFVYPYKDDIEIGNFRFDLLAKPFEKYLGSVFEDICREFLVRLFPFSSVGSWWHRGEEIDLVALNEAKREIVFFEVKWSGLSKRDAQRVLEDLRRKAPLVRWHDNARTERYGIIARSVEGKEELRKKGYHVYDLVDVEGAMRQ